MVIVIRNVRWAEEYMMLFHQITSHDSALYSIKLCSATSFIY